MPNPFLSPPSHYVYTVQPVRLAIMTEGPTQQEAAIVGQHWAYIQGLFQQGVVVFVGRILRTDETGFGHCVFRAKSEEEARAIMNADPAVSAGLMRAELYPYQVLLPPAGVP